MGYSQKKLHASVAVLPAPVQVHIQRPLAPRVASVTSVANDTDSNEMIPGSVHRSPGISRTVEENPGISLLGGCQMKGLCDQSSPQKGEKRKEEKEGCLLKYLKILKHTFVLSTVKNTVV